MQKALRGLMAEVLGHVAEHGLPGEHHFYIGIDTTHPGVDMPDWLRARYPGEMTIVLQDWFADLAVLGDRFQVTLNFSNQPQTLVVPFAAVQTFIDPSVKFGLKFDEDEEGESGDFVPAAEPPRGTGDADGEPAGSDDGDDGGDDGGGSSADIVRLDRFRKT
ncbi:SspB family protein [Paralimibaculum aggregatum]